MESGQITRVLTVANRTASTPRLIEAVRRRAEASPCEFALLIPDVTDRKAADWTLETAQRLLRPAARGKVEGLVGGPDPFESVKAAVQRGELRRDHHLDAAQTGVSAGFSGAMRRLGAQRRVIGCYPECGRAGIDLA